MDTNQEEKVESTSSIEKPPMNELSGFHTSYTSPGTVPWNSLGEDKSTYGGDNGDLSSSANNQDKQVQDAINQTPATSTSSSGVASVAQGYSGYAAYSNSDPYGYSSADYAAYYGQYQQQAHYQQQPTQYQEQPVQYQQPAQYQQQLSSYQQQTNQSYPQQTVGYQNSGASYQPLSSFQNTGSYGEPANYTSTYYNPGDYQTSGSYTTGPYSTQTTFWHGAPATNYGVNQYPNYTSDSNSAYGSTTVVTAPQYRQHYSQWSGYYSQSSTEVTCAPGTENITVSVSSTPSSIVSAGNTGFTTSKNPTAVYTSSWRPPVSVNGGSISEGNWKYGAPNFQNDPLNTVSSLVQNASEITTQYENSKTQHSISSGHGSTALDAAYYQGTQIHHQNVLSISHPTVQLDAYKASKLQIPTNPRIASNIPATSSRIDKDSTASGTMSKPAYIGVKIDKKAEKTLMQEEDNSMLKSGLWLVAKMTGKWQPVKLS
ncbi:hypothetical protein M569_05810 [Genlisea aurea]|uniref:Uncharacterized protein n=1 Tax=Genlisea aurea TaxID=192259 RepID=S8E014_9LAMI|nr:hypothetical protein M569_05810 [Genlisea aurea]